jgi:hypothetical protein
MKCNIDIMELIYNHTISEMEGLNGNKNRKI